ncbi:hypothetical protein BZG36_00357 [Bifiguratus adelaidae]|uniref:Nucleoporin Nup186/Nup192/Nup205 n=1 Tax=Bifiguratus adelaidae TaxID=1938954 RepID=A0A261Y7T3_9FUNG|nr:hypothetical protein BZG36_00357 [Bifiguratus adelaidae]
MLGPTVKSSVAFWRPRFQDLLEVLNNVRQSDPAGSDLSRSGAKSLHDARSSFLEFLDVPRRNQQHRQDIQNGKETEKVPNSIAVNYLCRVRIGKAQVNGTDLYIAQHERWKVLSVSDHLDVDEYYAASLLQYAIHEQSKYNAHEVEVSILLYHLERTALLECLDVLFDMTQDVTISDMTRDIVQSFVNSITERDSGATNAFAVRILSSIDILAQERKSIMDTGALPSAQALIQQHANADDGKRVRLSQVLTEERIKRCEDDQRVLASILYRYSFSYQFNSTELLRVLEILSSLEATDVELAVFLTMALLASLDVNPDHVLLSGEELTLHKVVLSDKDLLSAIYSKLVNASQWSTQTMRGILCLQFACTLIFAFKRDPTLETKITNVAKGKDDLVDTLVTQALDLHAFTAIAACLQCECKSRSRPIKVVEDLISSPTPSVDNHASFQAQPTVSDLRAIIDGKANLGGNFAYHIPQQFELLLVTFISSCSYFLRKLKNQEEDAMHASKMPTSTTDFPIPNHLETFFVCITLLYESLPLDSGTKFWTGDENGRLQSFVRWAVEVKTPTGVRAVLSMLASISRGPQCAQYVYQFLEGNSSGRGIPTARTTSQGEGYPLFSWIKLFGAVEFYATNLQNHSSSAVIPQVQREEGNVFMAFLDVCQQVCNYSDECRIKLCRNEQYRVVASLINLVTCPVETRLKAAVYSVLASICRQFDDDVTAANVVIEIARQMWSVIESTQILQTTDQSGIQDVDGRTLKTLSGIEYELEEIESKQENYIQTVAFVRLLTSLLHVSISTSASIDGNFIHCTTYPYELGASYRVPGLGPYVEFVFERVLFKLNSRQFLDALQRWTLADVCLEFIEKALYSFDINELLIALKVQQGLQLSNPGPARQSIAGTTQPTPQSVLLQQLSQPGYLIMRYALNDDRFTSFLFSIMEHSNNDMEFEDYWHTRLRAYRIANWILQNQNRLMHHIDPLVQQCVVTGRLPADISRKVPRLFHTFNPRGIDQRLLYQFDTVTSIAETINCVSHEDICWVGVHLMRLLSHSPWFDGTATLSQGVRVNRLTNIIITSSHASKIRYGYTEWLSNGSRYPVQASQCDIACSAHIALEILRLLVENTTSTTIFPTFAHYLLGFDIDVNLKAQRPLDSGVHSCLHAIIELLKEAKSSPSHNTTSPSTTITFNPVYIKYSCFVLLNLCTSSCTQLTVMNDLRNEGDLLRKTLLEVAIHSPNSMKANGNHAISHFRDKAGRIMNVAFTDVVNQIHISTTVLNILCLEIHYAAKTNRCVYLQSLIRQVYRGAVAPMGSVDDMQVSAILDGHNVILDLYTGFNVEWVDDAGSNGETTALPIVDYWNNCKETNEDGCNQINLSQAALIFVQRLPTPNDSPLDVKNRQSFVEDRLRKELRILAKENRRMQLIHAKRICSQAWTEFVEITISEGFPSFNGYEQGNLCNVVLNILYDNLQSTQQAHMLINSQAQIVLMLVERLQASMESSHYKAHQPIKSDLIRTFEIMLIILLDSGYDTSARSRIYCAMEKHLKYALALDAKQGGHDNVKAHIASIVSHFKRITHIVLADVISNEWPMNGSNYSFLATMIHAFDSIEDSSIFKTSLYEALPAKVIENYSKDASVAEDTPETVWDARASLLLAFAETVDGAQKVLQAGFISMLRDSSILINPHVYEMQDANEQRLPQSFIDQDTAIARRTLPLLYVLKTMLTKINPLLPGIESSLFDLIQVRSEFFTEVLRDDRLFVSLASLTRIKLVTGIFSSLATSKFFTVNMIEQSWFQPMLLVTTCRYLQDTWEQKLAPVDEMEQEMVNTEDPSHHQQSLLARDAAIIVTDIRRNCLNYIQHIQRIRSKDAASTFYPVCAYDVVEAEVHSPPPSIALLLSFLKRNSDHCLRTFDHYHRLTTSMEDENADQTRQDAIQCARRELKALFYLHEITLVILYTNLEHYLHHPSTTHTSWHIQPRYAPTPLAISLMHKALPGALEPVLGRARMLEAAAASSEFASCTTLGRLVIQRLSTLLTDRDTVT